MKKIIPYLVFPFLIFLALIPPISFFVTRPENDAWYVIVLIMAYAGVYTLFIKTRWFVKVIAIWSLILCFVCGSPLTALTSYFSVIICCYLYILCSRIEDWSVIFKAFQTLLFLNVIVVWMQMMGRDSLLNFGLGHDLSTYGIVGQHMQMGSFSIVLSAVLLPFSLWNLMFPFIIAFFCNSSWTLLTAGIGVYMLINSQSKRWATAFLVISIGISLLYMIKTGKIQSNIGPDNGRWTIWVQSIKWANHHPWVGWGAGTYKLLFPSFYLTPEHHIPYKTAHNWLVQVIFEMGYPFALFLLLLVGRLAYKLWKAREIICLTGLTMILIDMEVHFPERMLQTVGILICFFAYCEVKLKKPCIIK